MNSEGGARVLLKALSVLGSAPSVLTRTYERAYIRVIFSFCEPDRTQSAIAGSKTSASLLFISS